MREATAYIRSDREADAALLLAVPGPEGFYRHCGQEAVPELEVRTDEYGEPHASKAELILCTVLSMSLR